MMAGVLPTIALIQAVVNTFVQDKRMFTAYEVSKQVQLLGKDQNVFVPRHLNMREEVHAVMLHLVQSGEYCRVLQDVGAPRGAFVYYPANNSDGTPGDPTQYVPMNRDIPAGNTAEPGNVAEPVVATIIKDRPVGPNTRFSAKERLNIQTHICRAAGFQPGDTAFVVDEDPSGEVPQPCLVLLKELPTKPIGEYKVAGDARIRITPAMLKLCGLEGEAFEIEGDNGKIVVKVN
jgi:hypothetical protein